MPANCPQCRQIISGPQNYCARCGTSVQGIKPEGPPFLRSGRVILLFGVIFVGGLALLAVAVFSLREAGSSVRTTVPPLMYMHPETMPQERPFASLPRTMVPVPEFPVPGVPVPGVPVPMVPIPGAPGVPNESNMVITGPDGKPLDEAQAAEIRAMILKSQQQVEK